LEDFLTQAECAYRRVLSVLPIDQEPARKETIRTVLSIFAQEGLLDLGFLSGDDTSISPDDIRKAVRVLRCLASRSGSLASIYMVNAVLGSTSIALAGTSEQKASLLPRIKNGELEVSFAMTEENAGSDAAALRTTVVFGTDGSFEMNGEKLYSTGAATADILIVVARAHGVQDKRALSLFLVPAGAPGIIIEPLEKLSSNVHASCRVRLSAVRLPPEALLGGAEAMGKAWPILKQTGPLERLAVAGIASGLASAIVQRAIDFARSRQQFGQPIASFQAIQHALVEMKTAETAMHLFVERALASLSAGQDPTMDICMAKYFCAEQLQEIAAKAMRILGGRAYFMFEEMARFYREAPFSLYAGGTVEIQKLLIARAMGLAG
jgi:alkylation response protein AidB-like acyl-CoA dehydrogenase